MRAAENRVWVVAASKVGPLLPEDKLEAISAGLKVPPQWLHGAGENSRSWRRTASSWRRARAPARPWWSPTSTRPPPSTSAGPTAPTGSAPAASPLYAAIGRPPRAPARPQALGVGAGRHRTGDDTRRCSATRDVLAAGAALLVLRAGGALGGAGDARAAGRHGRGRGDQRPGRRRAHRRGGVRHRDRRPAARLHPVARLAPTSAGTATASPRSTCRGGAWRWSSATTPSTPKVFRLAAIAGVDVVAVPFTPAEDWELALGLPERAAENRLNIVAAAPPSLPAAFYALSPDFTLWTAWRGPFTGRISHPIVTGVAADAPAAAVLAPAQSRNKLVSRGTDLLDGRPWQLVDALTR
ncbi:hypothetical protein OG912_00080 [Streptomyces sp. NBC_00464]|uniref:hypothetical protein n=1 Tax=Streptomyces sp. NBC_00464 TaxID=2975751 RepID=UPI002E17E5D4